MGWIANAFILCGQYMLGHKWRHAFLLSIAGELYYTFRAVRGDDYELAFICAVFCILALRNWIKWGSDDNDSI